MLTWLNPMSTARGAVQSLSQQLYWHLSLKASSVHVLPPPPIHAATCTSCGPAAKQMQWQSPRNTRHHPAVDFASRQPFLSLLPSLLPRAVMGSVSMGPFPKHNISTPTPQSRLEAARKE